MNESYMQYKPEVAKLEFLALEVCLFVKIISIVKVIKITKQIISPLYIRFKLAVDVVKVL